MVSHFSLYKESWRIYLPREVKEEEDDGGKYGNAPQIPPEPIPNRPLRGERPKFQTQKISRGEFGEDDDGGSYNQSFQKNRPSRVVGENRRKGAKL